MPLNPPMVALAYTLLTGTPTTAVSAEAAFIQRGARAWGRGSEFLGYDEALRDLQDVAIECAVPGWDGFGARPVDATSLNEAERLLAAIPHGTRRPTISADPDGEVSLEWYASPTKTVSVSMTADGSLHYAALLGSSRIFGTEPFFGGFPPRLRELVQQVTRA